MTDTNDGKDNVTPPESAPQDGEKLIVGVSKISQGSTGALGGDWKANAIQAAKLLDRNRLGALKEFVLGLNELDADQKNQVLGAGEGTPDPRLARGRIEAELTALDIPSVNDQLRNFKGGWSPGTMTGNS